MLKSATLQYPAIYNNKSTVSALVRFVRLNDTSICVFQVGSDSSIDIRMLREGTYHISFLDHTFRDLNLVSCRIQPSAVLRYPVVQDTQYSIRVRPTLPDVLQNALRTVTNLQVKLISMSPLSPYSEISVFESIRTSQLVTITSVLSGHYSYEIFLYT